MTPAARLQAAIEILDALDETGKPADRFLRDWFRARRYAGSKDRAAIGERVFAVLRHRSSLGSRMARHDGRGLVIASLLDEGTTPPEIERLFSGQQYTPQLLGDDERAAIANAPLRNSALSVAGDFPQFLEPELEQAFGEDVLKHMAALNARAPIDLRVNTLKAERDQVLAQLTADGYSAAACRFAPFGIRIPSGAGTGTLGSSALFRAGAFEFQDEAAQIVSLLCAPHPGDAVLDYAAGAGGKSLALAALMENRGRVLACDIREGALKELNERAERAGTSIVRTQVIDRSGPAGEFDLVLLDAPCSGSGTWRRQPELKWRLTPKRLAELCALQDRLLDEASARVRVGGRFVYSTCSVLPEENDRRVSAFLDRNPSFNAEDAGEIWETALNRERPPGLDRFLHATPLATGTDGFFATSFVRRR